MQRGCVKMIEKIIFDTPSLYTTESYLTTLVNSGFAPSS